MRCSARVGSCRDLLDLSFTMGLLPFGISGPLGVGDILGGCRIYNFIFIACITTGLCYHKLHVLSEPRHDVSYDFISSDRFNRLLWYTNTVSIISMVANVFRNCPTFAFAQKTSCSANKEKIFHIITLHRCYL